MFIIYTELNVSGFVWMKGSFTLNPPRVDDVGRSRFSWGGWNSRLLEDMLLLAEVYNVHLFTH